MVRRRRLLLAAATAGATGLAGCIDQFGTEGSEPDDGEPNDGESDDDPDEGSPGDASDGPNEESDAVEHADAEGLVETYRTERYRADVADGPTFEQFGSAEDAIEFLEVDDGDDAVHEPLRDVVEATDFETEHLLAIEAQGPDLCHQLRLETVSATEADGLSVEASVVDTSEENEACADAIAELGLLVRISYADDAEKPSEGSISVSDGTGGAAGAGWASDSGSGSASRDVDEAADEG